MPTSQNVELAARTQSAHAALSELDSLRVKASRAERLEMEAMGLRRQMSIHSSDKIMCNVCRGEWCEERPQGWMASSSGPCGPG